MQCAEPNFETMTAGLDPFKNASDFPREQPYYKRVDARRTMGIFVASANSILEHLSVAPGSGIVGSPSARDDILVVHYEGNLHGASNLHHWRERVVCAAGRHATGYPTSAMCALSGNDLRGLIRVGVIHGDYSIEIDPEYVDLVREYAERYESAGARALHRPRP